MNFSKETEKVPVEHSSDFGIPRARAKLVLGVQVYECSLQGKVLSVFKLEIDTLTSQVPIGIFQIQFYLRN